MLTFSINKEYDEYMVRLLKSVEGNLGLFKKSNPKNWDEAVQRSIAIAIENRSDEYDDLDPYIRRMATTVMLNEHNSKEEIIEEIEQVEIPHKRTIEVIDESILFNSKDVKEEIQRIYLKYPEEFRKLEGLYRESLDGMISYKKSEQVEDVRLKESIMNIADKYGVSVVYNMLYTFLKGLDEEEQYRGVEYRREITLKQVKGKRVTDYEWKPSIVDKEGRKYRVDPVRLLMEGGKNPEFFKWKPIGVKGRQNIIKIDITPYIDYIYERVYVPKGVNTDHRHWCGDMYSLQTGAGERYVNEDIEVYMQRVREEIVVGLLENRVGTVIAVSPEAVYVELKRKMNIIEVKVNLSSGKSVYMPVQEYKI